jgi:hypothetical protein
MSRKPVKTFFVAGAARLDCGECAAEAADRKAKKTLASPWP